MRIGFSAIVMIALSATPVAARIDQYRPTGAPPVRNEARLRAVMLNTHNEARVRVGERPLAWDARLAAAAATYAELLQRSGRFEHSQQPRGGGAQGENLWMGTRGTYSFEQMVDGWIEEQRHYRPAPVPASSKTGRWSDVAHYTQIVWQEATAIGCAVASNAANDILVCRYSPPGNVIGEMPYR
jgi:uncharacterized protein YkwD